MDYDIIKAIAASGGGCALITVVGVTGSVPRHVGSKMAVMRGGSAAGTVGGGVLEARAVESAASCIAASLSRRIEVELTGSEALGSMPVCGGIAELWIEYVSDPAPFAAAALRLEAGTTAVLASSAAGGSPTLAAVFDARGTLVASGTPVASGLSERGAAPDPEAAARAAASGQAALRVEDGFFYDPILPPERLLVLGGGHVGRAVARLADGLGFRVTVADPRPEFADPARYPGSVESIEGGYEAAIAGFPFGPSTYALVVSPGHLSDLECARSILKREYRWAGFIGSRRKVRMVLGQLASEGFDRSKVEALAAPVGIDIGAETPEEIAVSILAEMIAVRRSSPALGSIAADRERRRA
jgi:xanthine dehydrogenase accessory factor